MKKCPDYTIGEGWESETSPSKEHPNSCHGCKYLYRVPYECWNCTCPTEHFVEEVPYPAKEKEE